MRINWPRSKKSSMPRTTMTNLRKTDPSISLLTMSIRGNIKEPSRGCIIFAGRKIPSRKVRKLI